MNRNPENSTVHKESKPGSEVSEIGETGWSSDPIYREEFLRELAKFVIHKKYGAALTDDHLFSEALYNMQRDAASSAAKSLIVLNGGAGLALMTKLSSDFAYPLPLFLFCIGAGCGALLFAGTYLAQHFYSVGKGMTGDIAKFLNVLFFFVGISVFFSASYHTFRLSGLISP